jgi:Putative porin
MTMHAPNKNNRSEKDRRGWESMFNTACSTRQLPTALLSASLLALAAAPSLAQEKDPTPQDKDRPTVSKKKPPGENATINLVNLLVQQGVIKEEQAQALIKQAQDDAYVARQAVRDANTKADEAARTATAASAAASPPGSKRVTYVPEIVKREMRDELRKEVMSQAKAEGWAAPGKYPEWSSRIRLYGDFRGRWESIFYPGGGYNSIGVIHDFNAINTGSPYDISQISNPYKSAPLINTTENRERARIRARVGLDADLAEGFTAGLRIATGSDSAPVSTNQTLGANGGNFSKYAVWLDRAFVRYEPFRGWAANPETDPSSVGVSFGRFDNPFWSPTELVWDADLGFDGVALQARRQVFSGFTPFGVLGAFPIFNTSLDFSTIEPVKFKSQNKYLFGGQLGFQWQPDPVVNVMFATAYFDFENVQGRLSAPCDLSMVNDCSTDHLRPSFAQKGNSYTYLRDIIPNAANNNGQTNQLQYFGLIDQYRPLVASGRIDFGHFDPVHIVVDGEYLWNTAFDRGLMERLAVNNRAADAVKGVVLGPYQGGSQGWLARVTVGNTKLAQFGDWNVHAGYKYLESDATVDAFVDSDFGLGGTNLKGYFVGGNYALGQNVWVTARWMSANAIAGPPYAVDLFQLDLNAKF